MQGHVGKLGGAMVTAYSADGRRSGGGADALRPQDAGASARLAGDAPSEAFLAPIRALLTASLQPMFLVEGAERVLTANAACRSLFGLASSLARPIAGTPLHTSALLAGALEGGFAGEPAQIANLSIPCEPGLVHCAVALTPLTEHGRVLGVLATCDAAMQHVPGARAARFQADLPEARVAENDLRGTQERLRLAQAVAAIGTFEWNIVRDHNAWSPEIERLHGLVAGSFGGTREAWLALVHPADREGAETAVARALETGELDGEWRIVRPDGEVLWVEARGMVEKDAEGRPLRMIGANIDITDRKRNEERVRRGEEMLRLALDATEQGAWDYDIVAERAVWDAKCYALLGLTPGEPLDYRRLIETMVHPEDRERLRQAARGVHDPAGNAILNVEVRVMLPNGRECWIAIRARMQFEGDGATRRPVRMIGSLRDVTERKRTEEALRASERRLAAERAFLDLVIENAPVGILILRDPVGEPSILNREARRLLGRTTFDGDIGRFEQLPCYHADGRRFALDEYPLVRALRYGVQTRGVELTFRTPPGDRRYLISATPLRDADGAIVGAVSAFADVEDQRRAEEHRKLLIDELNHRVKNTLAIVQAVAQQTFRRDAPPEPAIAAFSGRLCALAKAHDLLTRESWARTTLGAIAEDAVVASGFDPSRVATAGPPILLEPKQAVTTAMALHELFTNAAKYGALSRPDGRVGIEWRTSPGPDSRVRIVWREEGGPLVRAPVRRGFGTRVLERALAGEFNATVWFDYDPAGLVCTIDAPFPLGPGGRP